jgi:hypothetical protein
MLVRENRPVVLGHHLAAFDATGRCDHHHRSQEVPERNKMKKKVWQEIERSSR